MWTNAELDVTFHPIHKRLFRRARAVDCGRFASRPLARWGSRSQRHTQMGIVMCDGTSTAGDGYNWRVVGRRQAAYTVRDER